MANVQYDQLVGETFYEANLHAEKKYGKGNFEVITSKRIKRPIYMGLGHKELVELTVAVFAENTGSKAKAPARPLPSVEVSLPKTVFASQPEENFQPRIKPAAAPAAFGAKAYAAQQEAPKTAPKEMRAVHDLRSIQEGNDEPQSQKAYSDGGIEPAQIKSILDEIMAIKGDRDRQGRIANLPGDRSRKKTDIFIEPLQNHSAPTPPPIAIPTASLPSHDTQQMVALMQNQMTQIMEVLKTLNFNSSKALERKIPDLPEGLYEVKKNLLAIETPIEITDQIVFDLKDCLPSRALRYPLEALRETCSWFEQRLKFAPELDFKPTGGPKIVVLLGPTGVGKTTTIAKLAASYGLNMKDRKSIALFTLDTFRVGAAEQLQHYARIIDIDMEVLYRPEDIDQAVSRHLDKDLIIVDTAGRCQKDTDELCELASFIERLPDPSRYLVLSANTKYSDMLDTIGCFGKVGFDHLIFTKVDETNTVGPLLAILFKTGKSLAFITNGQKVPDDFRKADFSFFNSRMMIA